ncbi:diguanylate cyclase domain-containing protein, partial [Rhizobium leguminosarum]|uniref:diguanylate cyclase domain-containing protein n=1 Tax=Rhizobium leguminosarum TaxID=384 RepID=UPI003F95DC84
DLESSDPSSPRLYLVDLDGFKAVNDAWGHAVGDDLIRIFSNALMTSHPEVLAAARLGGDEFALVHDRGPCRLCEEAPNAICLHRAPQLRCLRQLRSFA